LVPHHEAGEDWVWNPVHILGSLDLVLPCPLVEVTTKPDSDTSGMNVQVASPGKNIDLLKFWLRVERKLGRDSKRRKL